MANTWGSLSWNVGNFGEQANATVTPTGIGLTSQVATPSVTATVDFGWSNNAWGEVAWNTNEIDAIGFATGLQLNSNTGNVGISGEINEGWGRITWGENAWGIAGDVAVTGIGLTAGVNVGSVIIDVENAVTGQELNLSLNSVDLDIGAAPGTTGQDLEIAVASPDVSIDAPVSVTGIGLTSAAGTLDGYNETGWGRDGWGEEAWGGAGIWVFVPVTGQQQNLTLASVTAQANADVDVTGQQLNTSVGDTTETGDGAVDLTGIELEFSVGDTTETADAIVSINNDVLTSFTAEADAQLSTAQAKFGPSSLLLDGTGDFVQSNASDVVQNNFTIEFFAYASNFAQDAYLWDNQSSNQGFAFSLTQFGQLRLIQDNTILQQTSASGLNNNQWNHIALVQNGLFLDLYINGTSRLQYNTGGDSYPGQSYKIGTNEGETQFFNGYIDEFRSSDIARYTTTFTPTTSAFTADSNTFALLHFDGANGSTTITNSVGSDIPRIALGVNDGTATGLPETIASVTEVSLNIAQGITGAGASADVFPTGQSVVITLGNEVGQAWKEVDTGDTVAYTEVSTGTTVSWSDVDTAA